ncbi:hypothetical protein RE654_02325 [Aeromonas caviae]|uniref:hypothetical protein n=1 Tax=Aeromonas caviae TaxID=648 RepID=UPI0028693047|nr:hypothetical protein [Aeromonas caviae]WMX35114.1 hypothetical protein RE654_02325 [Aeromonas caviae]
MMKAVIDTNVLRVAEKQHDEVSDGCVDSCVRHLLMMHESGIVVIDNEYRILGEYLKNPLLLKSNGIGKKFLKWLLQNQSNSQRVIQVAITETMPDYFLEFPDPALQAVFDPPDRKFVAVAHACPFPERPPIWQAADCKWLDWWSALHDRGVRVEFLCPDDICVFYRKKFPQKQLPTLPE